MILKYRVYDVQAQKIRDVERIDFNYHGVIEIYCCDGTQLSAGEESAILLRYSGYKDKNGYEIYNGDHLCKQGYWGNDKCGRKYKTVKETSNGLNIKKGGDWLRLGNIYINPELVEG